MALNQGERLRALALVQRLSAEIEDSPSATVCLENWCRAHGLAEPVEIVARRDAAISKPPSAEQRRRLEVGEGEEVRHRHVRLTCGDRVLAEADNWYVPGRLTDAMNLLLDTTDIPFGKVVQALRPHRHPLAVTALWSPDFPVIPDSLFEHRALLRAPDGRPFSEVDEVYKRSLLDVAGMRP